MSTENIHAEKSKSVQNLTNGIFEDLSDDVHDDEGIVEGNKYDDEKGYVSDGCLMSVFHFFVVLFYANFLKNVSRNENVDEKENDDEQEHDSVLSNGENKSVVNSASSEKTMKASSAKSEKSVKNDSETVEIVDNEEIQEPENESGNEVCFRMKFFVW